MTSPVALEIVSTGPLASLQDAGRHGLRRLGIPRAGTLIDSWRAIGNALVRSSSDAPVIEAFEAGLVVQARGGQVRLAVMGDTAILVHHLDGRESRPSSCCSLTLADGERLSLLSSGRARLTLIAVAGLSVRSHHGSVSTYARAGLGGLAGRVLEAGDRLPISGRTLGPEQRLAPARHARCLEAGGASDAGLRLVRAVAGPQDDAFDGTELQRFFAPEGWRISPQSDRMGCRLAGEPLVHRTPAHADIVSDAILPGAVQVPGNGMPIVMLADAHTAGGYPKIATVLQCDLPLLALARPGTLIRFERVDVLAGVAAARAAERDLRAMIDSIEAVARVPDTAILLAHNLIGGVVDACFPDIGEDGQTSPP